MMNPNPLDIFLSPEIDEKRKIEALQTVLLGLKLTPPQQILADVLKNDATERKRAFEYIASYYKKGTINRIAFGWDWELIHEFQPYVGDLFDQRNYIGNLNAHLQYGGGYGGIFPTERMRMANISLHMEWKMINVKIIQFYAERKRKIVGDKDLRDLTIGEWVETLGTSFNEPSFENTLDEHYKECPNDDAKYEWLTSLLAEVDYTQTEKHLAVWNWANAKKARLEPSIINAGMIGKIKTSPTIGKKVAGIPRVFGKSWIGDDEEKIMSPILAMSLIELRSNGKIVLKSRQGNLGWMIQRLVSLDYVDQEILLNDLPDRILDEPPTVKKDRWTKDKLIKIISKARSSATDHSKKLHEYLEQLTPRKS